MPPLLLFQTHRFFISVNTWRPAARSFSMCRQSMHTKATAPSRAMAAALPRLSLRNVTQNVRRHLACRHRELAMAHLTDPAHVAIDRHIVGRIGEDQVGRLAAH